MQTIVHIMESLERGGAETMFVDMLPQLSKHYNIVLVVLRPQNPVERDVLDNCHDYCCLNYTGFTSFLPVIYKLRKIIRKYDPIFVRSQLILSTIFARLACPTKKPLIFSIHSMLSVQIKNNLTGKVIRVLEKITPRKNDVLIGVSQQVVEDYKKNFPYTGPAYVLHNYVREEFFIQSEPKTYYGKTLNLVAVGNLRAPKNYKYLIESFRHLTHINVHLDIYGEGPLYYELNTEIEEYKLSITLKGGTKNIREALKNYDAFVMLSSFEGFGIAAAEAMAAGKALILSDIPVFKELTQGNAFFVNISNPDAFVSLIKGIFAGQYVLNTHVETNKTIAKEKYSKSVYVKKLLNLYETILKTKGSDSFKQNDSV